MPGATLVLALAFGSVGPSGMERVEIDPRGGFRLAGSGQAFEPRGFNYDHDERGRLIEDYWIDEWAKVEEDFAEMHELGANVVRVHLQFGKFCPKPGKVDAAALERLGRMVTLAERLGLYLDLTGLGCYHKDDVPVWYDALDEAGRWDAQTLFWRAVAQRCRESPAVFCYDLMNEPVVPGGRREGGGWLGPPFAGKHFVQFITLDQAERPRPEIARAWLRRLVRAIWEVDRVTLITVGLVDWSLERPGLTSGFVPSMVAGEVDFLAVHLYPERGKVDNAIQTLAAFAEAAGGKPVVIEETFPLKVAGEEFGAFLQRSRGHARGWIGFYWGRTIEELRGDDTIGAALTREWLERFRAGW